MNRDDIHKLIAGYATGTLTEDERTALFAAALEDQDLFDELAREQELKELIEEPGVRSRLVAALEPKKKWWEKAHWTWAAAATVAAVLLGVFLIQPPEPKRLAMVMPEPPKISQAPVPFVEPPPVGQAAPPLPPPAAVRQAQNGATPTLPPPPVQNANAPADALREVTIAAAPPPPPAAPAPAPAARAVTPIPQEAIGQLGAVGGGRGGGGRGGGGGGGRGAVSGFVQGPALLKAESAGAGFGFDYSMTPEGKLRVVPSANGFVSVGAMGQVVISNRALTAGSAMETELPEGSTSAIVVFSAQSITDSVLSITKSPAEADAGTVTDPNPSPNSRLEVIVPIRH